MPVYLVHGFRWPRDGYSGIRVHTIVHNLEEVSVEYIQNVNSREDLLDSFRKLHGDLMKDIESNGRTLEFIEQYDPDDLESTVAVSQPYAFVADKVVELAGQTIAQSAPQTRKDQPMSSGQLLSVNVEEVIADGPGLTPQAWEALAELRDKIAAGEKIGWWVVYNGDPERVYDSDSEYAEEDTSTPTAESAPSAITDRSNKETVLPSVSKVKAGPPVPPKTTSSRDPSIGSKSLPTRSKPDADRVKSIEPPTVKPEAILSTPKDEKIPDQPILKEVAKQSGFRKKFFGKKI